MVGVELKGFVIFLQKLIHSQFAYESCDPEEEVETKIAKNFANVDVLPITFDFHSSLLQKFVTYIRKKIYNIGP